MTEDAHKDADDRPLALMRERPEAGVRELAQALGLAHPSVSRRIARLKLACAVERIDGRWTFERPAPKIVWVRPINEFLRSPLRGANDEAEDEAEPPVKRSWARHAGVLLG
jgi:hypothetical protein